MKVSECAKLLDKSPQFVRMGLQLGRHVDNISKYNKKRGGAICQ